MRRGIVFLLFIIYACSAYAITCDVGEYLNGDICTPIDIGYDGVGCHADLPDEYTELEYLESVDHQYIDTKYIPTINTKISATFELADSRTVEQIAMGVIGANIFIGVNRGTVINCGFRTQRGTDTAKAYSNGGLYNQIHTVSVQKGLAVINGENLKFTPITNYSSPYSFFLFKGNYGYPYPSYATALRGYSFQIYENDILVRNMIPARRDTDGVLGMYDLVENKFYTNAGTGEFIAGPSCPYQLQCEIGYYCVNGVRHDCTNKPNNSSYTTAGWTTPECPWECDGGYGKTFENTCNTLCPFGATSLRTDTGVNVPLFSSRNTTPAINVKINNNICYADLVPGTSTGAINIEYNGQMYHTVNINHQP